MITYKNRRTYYIIKDFIDSGHSPSFEDVANKSGHSWSTARYHIHKLAVAGWITLVPGKTRSIKITEM